LQAGTPFTIWANRWMKLATYRGKTFPEDEGRIDQVVALWDEPIPGAWKREKDLRLLKADRRYCRRNAGEKDLRRGEHALEYEVLAIPGVETACFGGQLVDGVNAIPLAKDVSGGRRGNVEADMLLLVEDHGRYEQLLIEVKVRSNHAWYAAVENLRQLKLFLHSAAPKQLFQERRSELNLPRRIPVVAAVLAPEAFYTADGRRSAAVAPAERLLDAMWEHAGVDARLATWAPTERVIKDYPAA
jgi:hypothetical protein